MKEDWGKEDLVDTKSEEFEPFIFMLICALVALLSYRFSTWILEQCYSRFNHYHEQPAKVKYRVPNRHGITILKKIDYARIGTTNSLQNTKELPL